MPPPGSEPSPIRQAVVLLGGRGTRMWPLTAHTPKGLLPLAGIPFVEYQLRQLSAVGVVEVFLAVGRSSAAPWERFAESAPLGIRVHLTVEDEPLDTAGPVRAVLDRLESRFLVLNGDVVIEADLQPLIASTAAATLGLVEVADTSAYGVVVLGDGGLVERFIEKPTTAAAPARTVNAGLYLLTPEALAVHPLGPLSFERVVFPALAAAGQLRGVVLSGRWIDIGTPTLYLAAHGAVYSGGTGLYRPAVEHERTGARVDGRQEGAWSWIGPGARVAAGATIAEAVVMPGATIAEGAVVSGAVVGPDAVVGSGATITGAAVIGAGARVGPGCELDHGVRIAPGAVLEAGSVTFRPPQ
jgi:mannose-1-phosphate guanylyltransferase